MVNNKSKGLLNEFQIQITYLEEMADRLAYFEQVPDFDYKYIKKEVARFKVKINEFINRHDPTKSLTQFKQEVKNGN